MATSVADVLAASQVESVLDELDRELIGLAPVAIAATAGWLAFHPSLFLASWNPKGLSLSAAVGPSALTAFFAFLGVECAAATAGVLRLGRNPQRAAFAGTRTRQRLGIGGAERLVSYGPDHRQVRGFAVHLILARELVRKPLHTFRVHARWRVSALQNKDFAAAVAAPKSGPG